MRIATLDDDRIRWRLVMAALPLFVAMATVAVAAPDEKVTVPVITHAMVDWDVYEATLLGQDFCKVPVVRLNDEKLRIIKVDLNKNKPDEIIVKLPSWVQLQRDLSYTYHLDITCSTARSEFAAVSAELKALAETELAGLAAELEQAGAPWTPGRKLPPRQKL